MRDQYVRLGPRRDHSLPSTRTMQHNAPRSGSAYRTRRISVLATDSKISVSTCHSINKKKLSYFLENRPIVSQRAVTFITNFVVVEYMKDNENIVSYDSGLH